jgi:AbrB family looped-hinge helix DNA binding protein
MSGIFKDKAYGSVTIGDRGQLVIPAGLRRTLNIKPGDQLMVFAKLDKKIISIMPVSDFSRVLNKAAQLIAQWETKVPHARKQ